MKNRINILAEGEWVLPKGTVLRMHSLDSKLKKVTNWQPLPNPPTKTNGGR
jgi:hypothetical protein